MTRADTDIGKDIVELFFDVLDSFISVLCACLFVHAVHFP